MIYVIENIYGEFSVIGHEKEINELLFNFYTQDKESVFLEGLDNINDNLWTRIKPDPDHHVIFYNDIHINKLRQNDSLGHLCGKIVNSYIRNLKIDTIL